MEAISVNISPRLAVFIVLALLMFVFSFVLQMLLSKNENPWLGLILPILSFILALFWGIGRLIAHHKMSLEYILKDFLLFSSFNLATVIQLIIYFVYRRINPDDKNSTSDDISED